MVRSAVRAIVRGADRATDRPADRPAVRSTAPVVITAAVPAGTNFNSGRYGYNNFGYGGGYGRYAGANRFGYGNYGYNRYGYGGLGGYGGYGRYGYGRYGLGSTVLNVVNYGLGYGGYGGWGYSPYGYGGYGYGYRPWGGYYGYPWGFIASRVLFGIRPLLGLGFGYGYGGYGYGNNYGNSYYSTYSPVVTTEVPVVTTDVPVVEPAAVDPTLAANAGDYAAQGEADFQAGNYASAVKNWQHALVEDPDNATLVMMLSQRLLRDGQVRRSGRRSPGCAARRTAGQVEHGRRQLSGTLRQRPRLHGPTPCLGSGQ